MAKSKSKNKNITLILIALVAISILVIKAFVRLPLSGDSVKANGLYYYLNNAQFIETFIATILGVGFFCIKVLKLSLGNSCLFAVGFASLNLGIMIIDARAQKYNVFVESYIRQNYGSTFWIYCMAITALLFGIFSIFHAKKNL